MTTSTAVGTDLLTIARAYAANPADWPFAPRFDPTRRWYARLAGVADHEVWLLTWLPGQRTELHDHGGSAGAFVVVGGELTEHTVGGTSSRRLRETRLPAGSGRRFGAHHIHRVTNDGRQPAVSVHAYGPALRAMTRYRLDGGRLRVEAVEREGEQW